MTRSTRTVAVLSFLAGVVFGNVLLSQLSAQTRRVVQTTDLLRVDLGRNTAPARLLIFRIMEKGKEMTVYVP